MKHVLILRGWPGSGKSTWARAVSGQVVSADFHHMALHPDNTMEYKWSAYANESAHDWCKYLFQVYLHNGYPLVIVDNTNIKKKHYQFYVDVAKQYDYKVYQRVFTGNFENVHGVPVETVERMKRQFEQDNDLPHWE